MFLTNWDSRVGGSLWDGAAKASAQPTCWGHSEKTGTSDGTRASESMGNYSCMCVGARFWGLGLEAAVTVITGQVLEPLRIPTPAIGSGTTEEEGTASPPPTGALPGHEQGLGRGARPLPPNSAFRQ